MNFSDYQDFRLAVQKLIEGDDVVQGQATFSVNNLDLMIGLGEERVYQGDEAVPGLRASTMLTPLAIVPSGGVYTLPADLLELHEVYFTATRPLEIVAIDRLRALGTNAGTAFYAAQHGDTLEFWPDVATGTLSGSYYAKHEPLETGTWADQTTLARYPDVYLYAAITEAMGFLGFDSRVPFWQGKFRTAISTAMRNERQRVLGGSRLRVRAR